MYDSRINIGKYFQVHATPKDGFWGMLGQSLPIHRDLKKDIVMTLKFSSDLKERSSVFFDESFALMPSIIYELIWLWKTRGFV